MKEKILIDSNILVYAYDTSEGLKNEISGEIFEKILSKEILSVVSVQNLSEFFTVITEKVKNKINLETAKLIINDLISLKNFEVFSVTPLTIIQGIELCHQYKIHYWDALIAAVMKENNITQIYTENIKDFSKIPWIKAINPFTT